MDNRKQPRPPLVFTRIAAWKLRETAHAIKACTISALVRRPGVLTRRRSVTASPFAVLAAAELVETYDDRGIGQRIQDGDVGDVVEAERRAVRPCAPQAKGRGGGEVPQIFVVAVPGRELPAEAWLARISRGESELTGGREGLPTGAGAHPRGQERGMGDTVVGERDCARRPCTWVRDWHCLHGVVEGLREADSAGTAGRDGQR